jgi:hypothetical protein
MSYNAALQSRLWFQTSLVVRLDPEDGSSICLRNVRITPIRLFYYDVTQFIMRNFTSMNIYIYIYITENSMVWVRERTIPTERPPLVGKVIANFCGYRVPRGQRNGSLRPYSRFSRQEPLLFYQVAPQLYSGGWVDSVADPLLFFLVVPGIEPGPPDL